MIEEVRDMFRSGQTALDCTDATVTQHGAVWTIAGEHQNSKTTNISQHSNGCPRMSACQLHDCKNLPKV